MKKLHVIWIIGVGSLFFLNSCKKDALVTDSLYVPVASDVTATATLTDLQQGRTIYVNSCGSCHGLYSPDQYSVSNWNSILPNMAPRAGLSASEKALVQKYVERGK